MKVTGISKTDTLLEQEIEMALWVQRLTINVERQVKKAADESLEAVLAALAKKGIRPADMTAKQLEWVKNIIKESAAESLAPALDDALSTHEEMAVAVATTEAGLVAKATSQAVKKATNAWKLALENPIAATGDLLEPFVRDLEASAVDRMTKQIQIAMVKGMTLDETVRALKGAVSTLKAREIEAVVSTAMQHTYSKSRDAVFQAAGVEMVRCIATLDVRVCPACAALDGAIKQIDKAPKYPLHPRCRCLVMAETPLSKELQEGATRSSEDGYVPQTMTAFDFLKKKPLSELQEAYGPTVAAAIKREGMTATKFRNLALDRALKPASIGQMKEKLAKL